MATLEYAILGLLRRKEMSGYQLKKEFENNLFEFYRAEHSQIYPELKKLNQKNFVTFKILISGNVLEKKVYQITDEGAIYFDNWLKEEQEKYIVPKDDFKLKLYFSDLISNDERIKLIKNQINLHLDKLKLYKNELKKFSVIPPIENYELSDYLVLYGGIKRKEMMCDWLKECLRIISKK